MAAPVTVGINAVPCCIGSVILRHLTLSRSTIREKGGRVASKESRIVVEWSWLKHFIDEIVELAERCDVPLDELANVCMLSGDARREQLRNLGAAVHKRLEEFVNQPGDRKASKVPLRYAGLVQNSVACLRGLASSGDGRAGAALTYILLLYPEHVREDEPPSARSVDFGRPDKVLLTKCNELAPHDSGETGPTNDRKDHGDGKEPLRNTPGGTTPACV